MSNKNKNTRPRGKHRLRHKKKKEKKRNTRNETKQNTSWLTCPLSIKRRKEGKNVNKMKIKHPTSLCVPQSRDQRAGRLPFSYSGSSRIARKVQAAVRSSTFVEFLLTLRPGLNEHKIQSRKSIFDGFAKKTSKEAQRIYVKTRIECCGLTIFGTRAFRL